MCHLADCALWGVQRAIMQDEAYLIAWRQQVKGGYSMLPRLSWRWCSYAFLMALRLRWTLPRASNWLA